ncbi:hypothetical protein [Caldisericum exile]
MKKINEGLCTCNQLEELGREMVTLKQKIENLEKRLRQVEGLAEHVGMI